MLSLALASCGLVDALLAAAGAHRLARHARTAARHASALANAHDDTLHALGVPELKSRLSAVGVDTAHMFEKDELVQALIAAQPTPPAPAPPFYDTGLSEEDGRLYISVSSAEGDDLRLMIDTSTAGSMLNARTVSFTGAEAALARHLGFPTASELDTSNDASSTVKLDVPALGLVHDSCVPAYLPMCAAATTPLGSYHTTIAMGKKIYR